MGFVYSFMNSESPVNILSEIINIMRKLKKKNLTFLACPPKLYDRFMYIVPSSGEQLPNVKLPFTWILRRFEFVF